MNPLLYFVYMYLIKEQQIEVINIKWYHIEKNLAQMLPLALELLHLPEESCALCIWALSEDRYRGDIEGDWMVQTLRGKTLGVGKVPEPTTGIDTFESHQNLTDMK